MQENTIKNRKFYFLTKIRFLYMSDRKLDMYLASQFSMQY